MEGPACGSQFIDRRQSLPHQPRHDRRGDTQKDGGRHREEANRLKDLVPDVTIGNSVDERDVVANSAVRFAGINDAKRLKDEKSITATTYIYIAEGRGFRRRHFKTWRLTRRTQKSAALILDAKGGILGNLHSAHVEHYVVAFI